MRAVLVLALMLLAAGCQHDPYAHLLTTVRPEPSEVVGRYTLVKQTVTAGDLAALDGRLCVVDLRADGTFSADRVPTVVDVPADNVFNTLVSVHGSWRVDSVGSVDNGWSAKTHWGIYLDSGTAMLVPAGLTGQKAPYGLIFTFGDPDGGKAMFLERIK
jgi:hypothetical protein